MSDFATTPLFAMHEAMGAKMVPFAGYSMPVQYPMGVLKEHLHTRTSAGLFDVSHMGQVRLSGPSWEAVALAFEALVPCDVLGLAEGRQRYGFFTNGAGGIEDDLMFARRGDDLFLVVNAARKADDLARMQTALPDEITVTELKDRALIALQGPVAGNVVATLDPRAGQMRFMDVADLDLSGHAVWASRSGYTGEDGFEISVPAEEAEALARRLIGDADVAPIGLGARDSLRLEAGLCLYGHDIDETTSPLAAGLGWAIQKTRRPGGVRAGGFPGAEAVFAEIEQGPERVRVGLQPEERAPMREGVSLFDAEAASAPIGTVTSGGFGPSVQGPISMGYVAAPLAGSGTALWGEVRGKRLAVRVVDLPFVPARFKR
ncbi:glycine cleavage system aminomethyltransferase GcvT [Roseobacter weihaiensis]|uniref:glycine cleavage system aminomethyltransferase GcvT n=1 Tax=Roseobacter weihaiensis TaxID=2763262 RepID=UPI001D0A3544|nr:glycine cleavage system aminomethyltransferase GcvT [Roseobacter sp. H9]